MEDINIRDIIVRLEYENEMNTGFFISEEYILTCYHGVVEGADSDSSKIEVFFKNR